MVAVVILLIVIVACLLGTSVAACIRIEELMNDRYEYMEDQHAKCLSLIAAFVGDKFAAQVLMAAAEDYDSTDGQANLMRVRDLWKEGGPGIPSLWLRDRAEDILSKTQKESLR